MQGAQGPRRSTVLCRAGFLRLHFAHQGGFFASWPGQEGGALWEAPAPRQRGVRDTKAPQAWGWCWCPHHPPCPLLTPPPPPPLARIRPLALGPGGCKGCWEVPLGGSGWGLGSAPLGGGQWDLPDAAWRRPPRLPAAQGGGCRGFEAGTNYCTLRGRTLLPGGGGVSNSPAARPSELTPHTSRVTAQG